MVQETTDKIWDEIPDEIRNCETLKNHFRDRYYFELERKEKINASISIYFGITVLSVGAFIRLLDFIPQYDFEKINYFFWFFLFIFLICLITSSVFLIKSLFKNYQYVITPYKWIEHAKNTIKYYEKYSIQEPNLEKDIQDDLTGQYAEYAEHNSISNDNKLTDIAIAKKWLVITLIVALLGFSSMYVDKFRLEKKSEDIKVKIMNKQLPPHSSLSEKEKNKND